MICGVLHLVLGLSFDSRGAPIRVTSKLYVTAFGEGASQWQEWPRSGLSHRAGCRPEQSLNGCTLDDYNAVRKRSSDTAMRLPGMSSRSRNVGHFRWS